MDVEKATTYLRDWVAQVDAEWSDQGNSRLRQNPRVAKIVEGSEIASQIVREALKLRSRPRMVLTQLGRTSVDEGAALARQAIGALEMREETIQMLGPSAPAFHADAFHPLVWNATSSLWSDGHFRVAIAKAATYINADVQGRVNRSDISEVALMNEVFSDAPPQSGKPRLRWPGAEEDLTVKSMRTAVRSFAVGCFSGIRNLATHSTGEMAPQEALEHLAALSLLARWIENCELLEA